MQQMEFQIYVYEARSNWTNKFQTNYCQLASMDQPISRSTVKKESYYF